MKNSPTALALVLMAVVAMAHGPPSALDFRGVMTQQIDTSPTPGGGTEGITSKLARQSFPSNERMLN